MNNADNTTSANDKTASSLAKPLRKWSALRVAATVVLTVAVLAAAGAVAFFAFYQSGKAHTAAQQHQTDRANELADSTAAQEPESEEADGEVVIVNGKKYRYNENLVTILCMGIDSRTNTSFEVQDDNWGHNGQADAVFLAVFDLSGGDMKIIGISRDTMTSIPVYGLDGTRVGDTVDHLSYAWGYGDGAAVSSQSMMESVSYLFYGVPIDAYCALNFTGVPKLNDAVGGVEVMMTDEAWCKANKIKVGESYTLKGKTALSFVQNRDTTVEGSNNIRMARQKQYALAFVDTLKEKLRTNPTIISTLYTAASPYMLTDISLDYAVYLAVNAASLRFSANDLLIVQGTDNFDDRFNEFYVDDAALRQLVVDVFYQPVE